MQRGRQTTGQSKSDRPSHYQSLLPHGSLGVEELLCLMYSERQALRSVIKQSKDDVSFDRTSAANDRIWLLIQQMQTLMRQGYIPHRLRLPHDHWPFRPGNETRQGDYLSLLALHLVLSLSAQTLYHHCCRMAPVIKYKPQNATMWDLGCIAPYKI